MGLAQGDEKTKPEPWARALVWSAMGPFGRRAWLRGRWIVLLEIAMGRSQIFSCGAELLALASWGQGSSGVSRNSGAPGAFGERGSFNGAWNGRPEAQTRAKRGLGQGNQRSLESVGAGSKRQRAPGV